MRRIEHPETYNTQSRASNSIFELLFLTVLLGGLINFISALVKIPESCIGKILTYGISVLVFFGLLFVIIRRIDKRFGRRKIPVEFQIPLALKNDKLVVLKRGSYPVTGQYQQAWKTGVNANGKAADVKNQQTKSFNDLRRWFDPHHFDLLRYLLTYYLAEYTKLFSRQKEIESSLSDIHLAQFSLKKEDWPEMLQTNAFISAREKAFPHSMALPENTHLIVPEVDSGHTIMILSWGPKFSICTHPGSIKQKFYPGVRVMIKWLGPLSLMKESSRDIYDLIHRFKKDGVKNIRVLSTRLVIEIESTMNFLPKVGMFVDWALNLSKYLVEQMDIYEWWDYKLKCALADLDWKIGYINKHHGQSLHEQINELKHQVADLSERLDENIQE